MKKVIFDVDGVLFSEERYFDVSGLVVWEWLYSKNYMGLPSEGIDFNISNITDGQIAAIRRLVWGNDSLLRWLKAKGINSNWDMVHADLITILWIIGECYKERSGGERLSLSFDTEKDIRKSGLKVMGIPIPKAEQVLKKWVDTIPSDIRGHEVFTILVKNIAGTFSGDISWLNLFSKFYQMHTDSFQAWYLGDDTFISRMNRLPYSGGKEGFLSHEMPLEPVDKIKAMFRELKRRGYELGIATGRSREELIIPFKSFKWDEEFDPCYMATASDAFEASRMLDSKFLDKPHPFIFSCAIFGRNKENYKSYANHLMKPSAADMVYVCGDSYSDVLGGREAGAEVIGVLTGLDGNAAEAMFKEEHIHCIKTITDVLDYVK